MTNNQVLGKCKNCKFWVKYYEESRCDRVGDLHTERTPKSSFDIDVVASDDTGVYVELVTGPEFGCVQFVDAGKEQC